MSRTKVRHCFLAGIHTGWTTTSRGAIPSLYLVTRIFLLVSLVVSPTSTVFAQNYPNKPIRLVTVEPGGSNDFVSRVIAPGISAQLAQQIIVDNRPSGVIPGNTVAKAAPDGYTLLVAGGTFWRGSLLQKTPYDPVKDFAPVSLSVSTPNIVLVHPSLPVNSIKELISLARSRPGELNYASTGSGGTAHLAAELFKSMAGVNLVRIPYKGGGPATVALIAGEVQVLIPNASSGIPYIKSGKVRGLAVTSLQPSVLLPDLPTVAASGLPGYEMVAIIGVFAPAKTPTTIISQLNREITRFLNTAEAKDKFFNAGSDVVAGTPEQLADAVKSDLARMAKLIAAIGLRAE